jgi:hypothetical protein
VIVILIVIVMSFVHFLFPFFGAARAVKKVGGCCRMRCWAIRGRCRRVWEEESADVAAAVHSVGWFQSTGADVDAGADAMSASFSCLVPTTLLTV